ncbi:MAG: hypothetical protein HS120_02210 [Burkholderiales bacterium]|nr:hypothetical protein [Burkholderiales bacterium]
MQHLNPLRIILSADIFRLPISNKPRTDQGSVRQNLLWLTRVYDSGLPSRHRDYKPRQSGGHPATPNRLNPRTFRPPYLQERNLIVQQRGDPVPLLSPLLGCFTPSVFTKTAVMVLPGCFLITGLPRQPEISPQ